MGILAVIPAIGTILEKILGIVDKAVPDKDLAEKLRNEMQAAVLQGDYSLLEKELEVRAKALVSEIQGESWLQRNWRPILMLTIVAIVANNYILYPYLSLFTSKAVVLALPDALWNLMQIGVGGYIVGRTGEKMIETWKK